MTRLKVLLAGCSALALMGGALLVAQAQTSIKPPRPPIIIEPPIRPRRVLTLNRELQLETQHAKVRISGAMAEVTLDQTFHNIMGRRVEGTYIFPLPPGAAISDFAMTINGKRTEAEILDKQKARQIYDDIVRRLRDPAILEFVDRDLVQAHIFPIEANGKVDIEMRYTQPLRTENNSFRFNLPLRLPMGGAAQKASVDIQLQSNEGIRAVYSPTHQIHVKHSGNHAEISGEWSGDETSANKSTFATNHDFTLYYTTSSGRVGMNMITAQKPGEDGYFMMLLAPDPDISAQEIAAKDVVFVFDTSGSMSGEKIEQARHALSSLLENLNPDDRFNIITFSSDVRTWKSKLANADKNNLRAAREWIKDIKAIGGTNIDEALQRAVGMMDQTNTRPRQIVFLTDGQPTVGETNVTHILENIRTQNAPASHARLFVFGVGYDVNTLLLDSLAEENRGSADYVSPKEDIEAKVGALYTKIAYPVLTNPVLDWGNADVYDVYPRHLPDIFKGSQTIVFGRFKGKSTFAPQLTGTVDGKTIRIPGSGALQGNENEMSWLPRLWAMRKVGYLMDGARRSGKAVDAEVRAEIIALSQQYGIVTPFTAGLIAEDNAPPPHPMPIVPGASYRNRGVAGPAGPMVSPTPQSGQAAVAASKAIGAIRQAEQVQQSADLRTIAGKSFALKDGVWTDATYDPQKSPSVATIKFGSTEYFQLARDPQIAKWLSVGEKVLLVLKDKTVRVEP